MSTKIVAGRSFMPAIQIHDQASTKNALRAAELTAIMARRGFGAFLNKRHEELNALVGENACQIRASLLLDLDQKCGKDLNLVHEMQRVIAQTRELTERIQGILKTQKLMQGLVPPKGEALSFKEFCNRHQLSLEIPRECEFLLEACLLTLTSSFDHKKGEFTNPEKLRPLVDGLTRNFSKHVTLNAQKSLSKQSVEQMIRIANATQRVISEKFITRDQRGIQCLPGFFVLDLLMQKLKDEKNPILIIFKQLNPSDGRAVVQQRLLFRSDGKDFIPLDIAHLDKTLLDTSAFVIEGTFKGDQPNIKEFQSQGLIRVVLANVAQHPQLFGKSKFKDPFEGKGDDFQAEKERWLAFKVLSDAIGCSVANPSLFLIDHIFCRSIRNTLEDTNAIGTIVIPAATGAARADGAGAAADAIVSTSDQSGGCGGRK